jgi:hypothetical protein
MLPKDWTEEQIADFRHKWESLPRIADLMVIPAQEAQMQKPVAGVRIQRDGPMKLADLMVSDILIHRINHATDQQIERLRSMANAINDRIAIAMRPKLEATRMAEDGTVRKSHYGVGRQPWDDFVVMGWAAPFAAGCIIKYMRRTKPDPDDMIDAVWYYVALHKLCATDVLAERVLGELETLLTDDEKKRLVTAWKGNQ